MQIQQSEEDARIPATPTQRPARAVVTGTILLGVTAGIKLWLVTGVELGKDEAAYWYWGQHLDASYALLPFTVLRLLHELHPWNESLLRLGWIGAGSAASVLLYRLCRLHGLERSLSLWATAAFASSHWIWHTSSYIHPDGFLVPLWLASLLCVRHFIARSAPVFLAAAGAATGLALLSKYSAAFLAVALAIWVLVPAPRGQRLRALLWYGLPLAAISSPLLWAQMRTSFLLPAALGSLSRIVDDPVSRLPLFLLGPLLFASPLLLWQLYCTLVHALGQCRRMPPPDLLLALLPALTALVGFGFFALYRGQIKGNWILPAFLGLWPWAFSRSRLPARPTPFLAVLVAVGLLESLLIGLALRSPVGVHRLGQALGSERLLRSNVALVSPTDRPREPSLSWEERVVEYWGWGELAADLDRVLAREDVSSRVPLLSPEYGTVFGLAYYGRGRRDCFTVDDPRFRFLADFEPHRSAASTDTAVVVVRAGAPLPPPLRREYRHHRSLAALPRAAPGCPPILHEIVLLTR